MHAERKREAVTDPRVEAARLLMVEVGNVVSTLSRPGPHGRVFRSLGSADTADVADMLMSAVARYARADPMPKEAA